MKCRLKRALAPECMEGSRYYTGWLYAFNEFTHILRGLADVVTLAVGGLQIQCRNIFHFLKMSLRNVLSPSFSWCHTII